MDDKTIHDLAVAYAQAKLIKDQSNDNDCLDFTSDEIRSFLKSYHFAQIHIPEEDKEIDLSTLYETFCLLDV